MQIKLKFSSVLSSGALHTIYNIMDYNCVEYRYGKGKSVILLGLIHAKLISLRHRWVQKFGF